MIQLHYYPGNASLAPHFLLQETGAAYELKLVDRQSNDQKSEHYLRLNPAGRIPTLVHGNLVLFESPAICVYICELDSDSQFIPPQRHPARPLFFQWLAYLNNTLQTEYMMWRYAEKHTADPDGAEAIRAAQSDRLSQMLALVDNELAGKRYMLGDEVHGCDHFLFMLAHWCEKLPRPTSSYEHLNRFMREMSLRPAIQRACEIEGINLDRYIHQG